MGRFRFVELAEGVGDGAEGQGVDDDFRKDMAVEKRGGEGGDGGSGWRGWRYL